MGAQKTLGIDGFPSIPRVADSKSRIRGLLLLAGEELVEVLQFFTSPTVSNLA
jgi:hypothetical protein